MVKFIYTHRNTENGTGFYPHGSLPSVGWSPSTKDKVYTLSITPKILTQKDTNHINSLISDVGGLRTH